MIIGVSGKIGSGKDTVGKIIQYLIANNIEDIKQNEGTFHPSSEEDFTAFLKCDGYSHSDWKIVKFADTLKDIVCLLTCCTREQLEDIDFKNSKLPKEWESEIPNGGCSSTIHNYTYRKLLQILGTDLLRNQLHENVWVNSLMNKYKAKGWISKAAWDLETKGEFNSSEDEYPNWIITDVRFPNEAKAIKDRGGINIRINRKGLTYKKDYIPHPSETALDHYSFNYIIDNNGTIEDLINSVKEILTLEKLI